MAKQLQELQKENSRLKKLVADQALDMLILKEAARPHACVPPVNRRAPFRRRRTMESVRRTLGQEKASERRVCRVLGRSVDWLLSCVSRTVPLRTIRLDLGLNLFGRQGRCSAWRELEPLRLHLGYAGRCESFSQDRFDRAGLKQAFGSGLPGEGIGNRDLDGGPLAAPAPT